MKTAARVGAILFLVVLLAASAAAGWPAPGREPPADGRIKFDRKQSYEYVRRLVAFGPRVQGSAAEAAAAEYLRRELTSYGYIVELQPFAIPGDGTGRNVIAHRPGRAAGSRWLAVGAHYDTVPGTVGANDNGSGTAVALELAKALSQADLPYSLRFVFFSAEEDRNPRRIAYSGSRAYVASLTGAERRAALGYINIDMVGWRGPIYVGNLRPADQSLYRLTAKVAAARHAPKIYTTRYAVDEGDHQSFKKAGIPTVSLGALDYPYRHKPSDSLDKISARRLETTGRLIVDVLQAQAKRTRHK